MDIATSSRAYFAMPSPSPSEKISLSASSTVYTYHCLCTHLLLATTTPLPSLPTRNHAHDKAHIMPLPPSPQPHKQHQQKSPNNHYGLLLSTRSDRTPEIITSDSGFEKRYAQRCGRCNLVIGYQLDWRQFSVDRVGRREDFVFLLPGGFLSTKEMIAGKQAASAASASTSTSTSAATNTNASADKGSVDVDVDGEAGGGGMQAYSMTEVKA